MNTEVTNNKNKEFSTGVRLRNAREQLGLSQKAVADRLCLKLSIIRDIEEDKIPTDLVLTFLCGYIRSYAKLVHIQEEEILQMIEKHMQTIGVEKVKPMKNISLVKYRKKNNNWLANCIWLTLFILIGLTGAWWQNHKVQQQSTYNTTSDQQSTTKFNNNGNNINVHDVLLDANKDYLANKPYGVSKTQPSISTKSTMQNTIKIVPSIQTSQVSEKNTVISTLQKNIDAKNSRQKLNISEEYDNSQQLINQISTNKVLTNNLDMLIMNFIDDCWLEVIDATGKKLFSGLQSKNNNLNLIGQVPYKLRIGAPSAIQIQYRGKHVDLNHFIKTNRVAHFILKAE